MQIIHQSQYFTVFYHEVHGIFESSWLNSQELTSTIFKKEMLIYVELAKKYKPTQYLVNDHDNKFVISIELQDWVNEYIFPHTMHEGVKKFALVVPQEIFAQISLEQTIETGEENIKKIPTQYFPNRETSVQWLNA